MLEQGSYLVAIVSAFSLAFASIIGLVIYVVRIRWDVDATMKDQEEIAQTQSVIFAKIDNVQSTVNIMLQAVGKMEGRLENYSKS
jgi:hypothetical protein